MFRDMNMNLLDYSLCNNAKYFLDNHYSMSLFPLMHKSTRSSNQCDSRIDNIFTNALCTDASCGIILDDIIDHFTTFRMSKINIS